MTQKLWDAAKAVLRGKFIAIQASLKKQEKYKQPNLSSKGIIRRRETKLKVSRKKKIIKIREEINKIDTSKNHNRKDQ